MGSWKVLEKSWIFLSVKSWNPECFRVKVAAVCVAESLFSRLLAHTYRWSQTLGGDQPHVFRRKARFFLDNEHDFVLELAADHLARIKASTRQRC